MGLAFSSQKLFVDFFFFLCLNIAFISFLFYSFVLFFSLLFFLFIVLCIQFFIYMLHDVQNPSYCGQRDIYYL